MTTLSNNRILDFIHLSKTTSIAYLFKWEPPSSPPPGHFVRTQVTVTVDIWVSLYLRSRVYCILWRKPFRQLITRRDTDVTIDIDWQPNPGSMISRKLGITEDMLIEHGVFSTWQEYKWVFIAQWLSPMDTCKNNITSVCCCFVAVTASRSVFSLIENQTFAEEPRRKILLWNLIPCHGQLQSYQLLHSYSMKW